MWLREAQKCLVKNEKAKSLGNKLQICYSQPKNIKRIITQKKAPNLQNKALGVSSVEDAGFPALFLWRGGPLQALTLKKPTRLSRN
jgi:hypothetical protein